MGLWKRVRHRGSGASVRCGGCVIMGLWAGLRHRGPERTLSGLRHRGPEPDRSSQRSSWMAGSSPE